MSEELEPTICAVDGGFVIADAGGVWLPGFYATEAMALAANECAKTTDGYIALERWWKSARTVHWHSIETAPKDGTQILTYWPEGRLENDENYDQLVLPVTAVVFWSEGWWEGNTYFQTPHGEPTHWMPLIDGPLATPCSPTADDRG